jgi:effector-binding domain-containing protein
MKRFSNVFLIVLGLIALLIFFGWFFYQKTTNSEVKLNDADTSKILQNEGLVLSDSNYVLKQTEKPKMRIIGKTYKAKYEDLAKLISQTASPLMNYIAQNKLIITGSIMSVYNEIPANNKEMEIFIGIPVDKEIKSSEFLYRNIDGGKFHKITANVELGKGAQIWNVVSSKLEMNGNKITFPIIEYPSDSRNSEMTTAITQVNLLIPVK